MSKTTTVFGIPNCDTVKKARKLLDEQAITYTFHDFKKQGVTAEQLTRWTSAAGWEKVLNRQGTTWRKLDEETSMTDLSKLLTRALTDISPETLDLKLRQQAQVLDAAFNWLMVRSLRHEGFANHYQSAFAARGGHPVGVARIGLGHDDAPAAVGFVGDLGAVDGDALVLEVVGVQERVPQT